MPFTFNDRQKSVAFFLLTGFFFILVLIVLVASGSDLVALKQKQYTYFTDSHGFTGGTTIKYRGFNVGKISKISLVNENEIRADLYFYKRYAYLLRHDSVLKIQSSLLGSSSLVLMTNQNSQADKIKPKELIFSSDMDEGRQILTEVIEVGKSGDEMTDKVKLILDDIHNLKPSLDNTLGSLTGALNNVSTMIKGMEERKDIEKITELLQSTLIEMKNLIATVKKALGK